MSETYAVQVNPTIGGVLWNIRGGTAEEFKKTMEFLGENASDIHDALAVVQQAGLANQAVATVAANPVNAGTPPPGSTGGGSEPPTCPHGPMKDLAGKVNKQNQPYKNRYYCSKFGSDCKPRD